MNNDRIYDAFGPVPSHVSPSIKVRRWDQGLLAGAFAFSTVYGVGTWLGYHVPGTDPLTAAQWGADAWSTLKTSFHYLTGARLYPDHAANFWEGVRLDPLGAALRLGLPLASATAAAWWLAAHALTPRNGITHVAGPELLDGKRAVKEARRRSLSKKDRLADRYRMRLHPDLLLPKKHWSRHTLIYGSVGSGKTQVLLPLIKQLVDRNRKLFLYDVKGDFTSYFKHPIIVSPFDARSYVWDVGADVRTPTEAAAFASSLIPEAEGNGKFWSIAAQQILIGVLRELQNTKGTDWGWTELAAATSRGAAEMAPALQRHYLKAAPLIANEESQSTASVLATLAGFTRVIDDLALAWPTVGTRRFSIREWVADDYKGRRQVIVQSGADANLTRAYIAAMVNVAVPSIISPSLPDNETGRCLAFVFDELTSIGKIDLGPLVDKGRSKGVVVIAGVQDLAQIKEVYGENMAKAMTGMIGTHIICQVQLGDTRRQLAELMSSRKVAITDYAGGRAIEEGRPVVHPDELTDRLGFRRGKSFGEHRWGIRAIVQMGGDPLLLDFPGVVLPKVREGQVAASWTTRPAGESKAPLPPPIAPPPTPEQRQETVRALRQGRRPATERDLDDFLPPV